MVFKMMINPQLTFAMFLTFIPKAEQSISAAVPGNDDFDGEVTPVPGKFDLYSMHQCLWN